MDKYIIELLKVESTVIVPGLGALMNGATEGTYIFNKYLKINDHKLEEYISKTDGVDAQEAANSVAKLVREINAKLDKGETYDIFGLGKFFKDEDGSIDFESKPAGTSTSSKVEKKEEPKKETPKVEPKAEEPKKEIPKPKVADKSPDLKKEAEKPKNVITPIAEEKSVTPEKPVEKPKTETPAKPTAKPETPKENKEEPKSAIKKPVEEKPKTAAASAVKSKVETPAKDEKANPAKSAKEKAAEDKMKAAELKKKKADDAKVAKAKAEEEKRKKVEALKKAKEEAKKKKLEAKQKKSGAKPKEGDGKKKGGNGKKILLIILIAIVLGGGAFITFKWDMFKDLIGMNDSKEEPKEEKSNDSKNEDKTHQEEVDHANENVTPEDTSNVEENVEENNDEVTNNNNEEIVNEDVNEEPPVVKEEPKVNAVTSAGSYHIIVGGFSDNGNADRLVAELQSKGFPAQNLGQYSGLSLVSIKSYGDMQSAKSDLGNFSDYNGAWIFKKK